MTIAMQGLWTVSVKSKDAAWSQRYRIQGSTNGADGIYDDTSPPITVAGPQWGITVEHNPSGPISWRPSRHRLANFRTSGGQFLFDIETDDYGGNVDEDFNDLVLTCAMAQSSSEYVIYGKVKSYSGLCYFNPCFPLPYYVIEYPWQLSELLAYKPAREIIEKLYPERVRAFEKVPPFPPPDPPPPFRPMMLPSGLGMPAEVSAAAQTKPLMQARSVAMKSAEMQPAASDKMVMARSTTNAVASAKLDYNDYLVLGKLHDSFQLKPCVVRPVSQTLLRFTEYDRTVAEKLGEAYSGDGDRQILGITATDDFGNYIYRFSQDLQQLVDESYDIATGEDAVTQMRPDIIIELLESVPDGVMYETAPYYNISNVKQINLCLPSTALDPPRTACQGGRAIQALGNLSIITAGTTLHSDGTVSNTSPTGPIVDHAAWYKKIDLFACFLDTNPRVEYYVLRYLRDGDTEWNYVNEEYTHPKQQADGTWQHEKVGPHPVALRVNGPSADMETVGAYLNIEDQVINNEWQNTKRDRKLQIDTRIYQVNAGSVHFSIEGYDASGEKVPGANDIILLYIDNTWSDGDVDYVKLGTEDPGECALIEMPTAGEALNVRYRVTDAEGFMQSYALRVYRGSNTLVPTENTATGSPVTASYQSVAPYRFSGTLDETLDPSGYVEVSLQPTAGAWLPVDKDFCAFSFELTATDRKTNGYGTPGNRMLWRELIGISYTPPVTP